MVLAVTGLATAVGLYLYLAFLLEHDGRDPFRCSA